MTYEDFQKVCFGYIERIYGPVEVEYHGSEGSARYVAKISNGTVLVGYPTKMMVRVLNEVTRQASGTIWG